MFNIILDRNEKLKEMMKYWKMLNLSFVPVWKYFLDGYRKDVIETNFSLLGVLFGKKWKGLKLDSYRQYKKSVGARGRADLVLTGRLKRAALGQSSDAFQDYEAERLTFGIQNIDYAGLHQTGGKTPEGWLMPQRPYLIMKDNKSLPGRGIEILMRAMQKHYNGELK